MKIKLPRKPTDILMAGGLILISLYFNIAGQAVTSLDRALLLVCAAIFSFALFLVIKDRITLYGWSIPSIILMIPFIYLFWIWLKESDPTLK